MQKNSRQGFRWFDLKRKFWPEVSTRTFAAVIKESAHRAEKLARVRMIFFAAEWLNFKLFRLRRRIVYADL